MDSPESSVSQEAQEVLTFRLGNRQFGIELSHVREIVRLPRITRLPLTPDYVLGIMNVSGNAVPAISAGLRLGLPGSSPTRDTRAIILKANGVIIGLVVDEVKQIRLLHSQAVPAPGQADHDLPGELVSEIFAQDGQTIFKLAPEKLIPEVPTAGVAQSSPAAPRLDSKGLEVAASSKVVITQIGREEFGISIDLIQEVVRFVEPNPLPDAPIYLLGVITMRSEVMPVIDLRSLMKRKSAPEENALRLAPIKAQLQNARTTPTGNKATIVPFENALSVAKKLPNSGPSLSQFIKRNIEVIEDHRSGANRNATGYEQISELEVLLGNVEREMAGDDARRILVISAQGSSFGLAVDSVTQILSIPISSIQPPPQIADESSVKLEGVARAGSDRLILLLNLEEMIQKNALSSILLHKGAFAQTADSMTTENTSLQKDQWVTFAVDAEEFALRISDVLEIGRLDVIARIPSSPDFLRGVVNLRGEVIPVIDLRKRFGLPPQDSTERARIIYYMATGVKFGMIVDSVSQIVAFEPSDISVPPAGISSKRVAEYLTAIATLDDRMILLLNAEKLLTLEEQENVSGLAIQSIERVDSNPAKQTRSRVS